MKISKDLEVLKLCNDITHKSDSEQDSVQYASIKLAVNINQIGQFYNISWLNICLSEIAAIKNTSKYKMLYQYSLNKKTHGQVVGHARHQCVIIGIIFMQPTFIAQNYWFQFYQNHVLYALQSHMKLKRNQSSGSWAKITKISSSQHHIAKFI